MAHPFAKKKSQLRTDFVIMRAKMAAGAGLGIAKISAGGAASK
jgi:hypothetical protein